MNKNLSNREIRSLICGLDKPIPLSDGSMVTGINFDNAATTPPLNYVLYELMSFAPWYSSIHRGTGFKSKLSSNFYDNSRKIIAEFVGCDYDLNTVVYVKNTTEAINKLSYRLCGNDNKCIILSTGMEHHSNDLPWRDKYHVEYIETDDCGRLCFDDLEQKLINYKGNVKLVTVTGASNATGYVNPIHEIAELSHRYGAKILVDGAQLVPHVKIDMKPNDSPNHIDFLVFSAHKMYAPFGIGVLIGQKNIFDFGNPDYVGGGTVQLVTPEYTFWDSPPNKEEAGSPNIMGVVALVAAIKMLKYIGMDVIEENEIKLTQYALDQLLKINDVKLYCSFNSDEKRVGIIPFNIKGVPHGITAQILSDEAGIAVRNGCFCAQPYLQKLLNVTQEKISTYLKQNLVPPYGVVRMSFGIYNNEAEVDALIKMVKKIIKYKSLYLRTYSTNPLHLYNPDSSLNLNYE